MMLFAYRTLDCIATEIIILILFFFSYEMEETVNALSLSVLDSFLHLIFDWQFGSKGFSKAGEKHILKKSLFSEVCKWHIHTVTVHWLID